MRRIGGNVGNLIMIIEKLFLIWTYLLISSVVRLVFVGTATVGGAVTIVMLGMDMPLGRVVRKSMPCRNVITGLPTRTA